MATMTAAIMNSQLDPFARPASPSNSDRAVMVPAAGARRQQEVQQVLVRLDNSKTYLLRVPAAAAVPSCSCPTSSQQQHILHALSASCSIPQRHLRILTTPTSPLWSDPVPHLSASSHVPIRGGKGGFGTLLKGQSKQAGAKTTLDFGACRDLSGRRLRHINDEVKLRKWRDAQARRERGLPVDELEELRTESGIRNWHLMVPSWADGAASSNKARRKAEMAMKREVERWKSAEEREQTKREEAKQRQQMAVAEYVRAGEVAAGTVAAAEEEGKSKKDVILGIMMQKKKNKEMSNRKRGRQDEKKKDFDDGRGGNDDAADAEAGRYAKRAVADVDSFAAAAAAATNEYDEAVSYLCTLSGDFVVDDVDDQVDTDTKKAAAGENSKTTAVGFEKILLQSQSEFATAAVLLSRPPPADAKGLYYEVKIRSGGLAQIGWAYAGGGGGNNDQQEYVDARQFRPNSDTGDGVGDDGASFGYDGYRGLAFHAGKEKAVAVTAEGSNAAAWKDGDVVGCTYDTSRRVISYSLNGKDIGVTFEVGSEKVNDSSDGKSEPALLFPAVSLNQGEVFQINVGPNFEVGNPAESGYIGICELIDWEENGCGGAAVAAEVSGEKQSSTDVAAVPEAARGTSIFGAAPGMIMPPVAAPRKPDSPSAKLSKAAKDAVVAVAVKDDNGENNFEQNKQEQEHQTEDQPPPPPFDLNKCESLSVLKELGLDRLKGILLSIGCKCGGSLDERAERLFSLKGLKREDYPKKVRGKGFVV